MAALEQPPTPVTVDVQSMSEEQLEEKAYELEQEAERHRVLSRSLIGECARLRSRAQRMREQEQKTAEKRLKKGRKKPELPYDPNDPLIASTILATEDLDRGFTAGDLAEALHVARERAVKLLLAVEARGLVARQADEKWRSVDPNESLVRDGARRLGQFTVEQLGEEVGMTPAELSYYMEWMVEQGMIVGGGPMFEVRKLDPERTITTVNDGRYRLPEHDPPSGTEILSPRGAPVYAPNHGDRGRKMNQPGQKLRMKQRDQRREKMQDARKESADKRRAKQQKDPHAAKRAKASAKRRARLIS